MIVSCSYVTVWVRCSFILVKWILEENRCNEKLFVMLYTEIPSDLLILSKLTHKQKQLINKRIKHQKRTFQKPEVVKMMAETKMN